MGSCTMHAHVPELGTTDNTTGDTSVRVCSAQKVALAPACTAPPLDAHIAARPFTITTTGRVRLRSNTLVIVV